MSWNFASEGLLLVINAVFFWGGFSCDFGYMRARIDGAVGEPSMTALATTEIFVFD